jgi:hypothetical protein
VNFKLIEIFYCKKKQFPAISNENKISMVQGLKEFLTEIKLLRDQLEEIEKETANNSEVKLQELSYLQTQKTLIKARIKQIEESLY